MKLFYSKECALHNPEFEILSGKAVPYLESPDRMARIMSHLSRAMGWSWEDVDTLDSVESSKDAIEAVKRVHSPDYIEYLRDAYESWVRDGGSKEAVLPEVFPHPGLVGTAKQKTIQSQHLSPLAKAGLYCFDLSCPITADTFGSALAAVRVVLQALRYLTAGASHDPSAETAKDTNKLALPPIGVFALTRPPGHHAGPGVCGGYCFLNNVAIAVKSLQAQITHESGEPPKVAILDIDYHHGNGTQDVFYQDPTVLYVSLHAEGDYPYFTGAREEAGDGPGTGFNLNIPLPQHQTGNEEYLSALRQGIDRISQYSPQWLVISLGVDTYKDDPICNFRLTTECYSEIGREIGKLGLPTLFAMEGGYHLDTLGANVGGVLSGFEAATANRVNDY